MENYRRREISTTTKISAITRTNEDGVRASSSRFDDAMSTISEGYDTMSTISEGYDAMSTISGGYDTMSTVSDRGDSELKFPTTNVSGNSKMKWATTAQSNQMAPREYLVVHKSGDNGIKQLIDSTTIFESSDNFNEWLDGFERAAKDAKATIGAQTIVLLKQISQTAFPTLNDLIGDLEKDRPTFDWNELRQILSSTYYDDTKRAMALEQWSNMRQKSNETIAEFGHRYASELRIARGDSDWRQVRKDPSVINDFIRKLASTKVQEHLKLSRKCGELYQLIASAGEVNLILSGGESNNVKSNRYEQRNDRGSRGRYGNMNNYFNTDSSSFGSTSTAWDGGAKMKEERLNYDAEAISNIERRIKAIEDGYAERLKTAESRNEILERRIEALEKEAAEKSKSDDAEKSELRRRIAALENSKDDDSEKTELRERILALENSKDDDSEKTELRERVAVLAAEVAKLAKKEESANEANGRPITKIVQRPTATERRSPKTVRRRGNAEEKESNVGGSAIIIGGIATTSGEKEKATTSGGSEKIDTMGIAVELIRDAQRTTTILKWVIAYMERGPVALPANWALRRKVLERASWCRMSEGGLLISKRTAADGGAIIEVPRRLAYAVCTRAIVCNNFGCRSSLENENAFNEHYEARHRHVCAECRRSFHSQFLLQLHESECHDPFFQIKAEKEPSYCCLLPTRSEKFATPENRKDHMIRVHRFPNDYRFYPSTSAKKVHESNSMDVDAETASTAGSSNSAGGIKSQGSKPVCFGVGSKKGFDRRRLGKAWHQSETSASKNIKHEIVNDDSAMDLSDISKVLP